ncbi:UDP-N-acetylmuramate dehydrogenase [Candidatus Pelagibacter sp.]|nr:UDP-N-acetylmuramate dehydrogenase [Candidatus Pelagibacter sp.]
MEIEDIKKLGLIIDGDIFFDQSIKNLNWFNIGGKTKIFFKPNSLKGLIEYLKLYGSRGKIFVLGNGSNVLFDDDIYQGTVIKLGKSFSNITLLDNETIIAGTAVSQKKVSEFAKDNGISGLEFMSCIPGSIGGGIRMNSGCFKKEFKDILISIQLVDFKGFVRSIPANKINFKYRSIELPDDLIFLSATFKGKEKNSAEINDYMNELHTTKNMAQPIKIKTSGSTFKNPINQTDKKVWELIRTSVPNETSYGDAIISEKHANFFVNKKNAKSADMKSLINFVKKKVKDHTGVKLELEIVVVE